MRISLVGLVIACLCPCAAGAQQAAIEAAIDADDVRYYAELLGLDEEQRQAAIEYVVEYHEAMQQAEREVRERVAAFAPEPGEGLSPGQLATFYEGIARSLEDPDVFMKPERIERRLLADVIALAEAPAQREAVQRVERAWRRHRVSAMEDLHGSAADLVEMARELEFGDFGAIGEILLEYEAAIDPVRSDQLFPLSPQDMLDPGQLEWIHELALKAKKINIEFAGRIQQELPASSQVHWDRAVREAFWPEPYARSRPQRFIGVLRRSEGLTDANREQLDAIVARYEEQAAPINRDWAAALDAALHAWAAHEWDGLAEIVETINESREARRVLDREFQRELSEFNRDIQSRQ